MDKKSSSLLKSNVYFAILNKNKLISQLNFSI